MVNDPVADLIVQIKNASMAKRSSVTVPFSNFKWNIVEILAREGFVGGASKQGKKTKKYINVELKYAADKKPEVSGVARVSKLGKRVYFKADDVRPVKFGHGLMILSTPKGLKTDKEAKKEHLGGEALFKIW